MSVNHHVMPRHVRSSLRTTVTVSGSVPTKCKRHRQNINFTFWRNLQPGAQSQHGQAPLLAVMARLAPHSPSTVSSQSTGHMCGNCFPTWTTGRDRSVEQSGEPHAFSAEPGGLLSLEIRVWEVEASRICRQMPGERGEEEGREGVGGGGGRVCSHVLAHTHTHVCVRTHFVGGQRSQFIALAGLPSDLTPFSGQRRAWFAGITG